LFDGLYKLNLIMNINNADKTLLDRDYRTFDIFLIKISFNIKFIIN